MSAQQLQVKNFLKEFKLDSVCDVSVTNKRDLLTSTSSVVDEDLVVRDAYGNVHQVTEIGMLVFWKYAMACYYVPTLEVSILTYDDFNKLNKISKGILTERSDKTLYANVEAMTPFNGIPYYIHPEEVVGQNAAEFYEPEEAEYSDEEEEEESYEAEYSDEEEESYDGGEAFSSYVPPAKPGLYGDYESAKPTESSGKIMLDLPDNRVIMDLLVDMALEHGQFLENSTPDATGRIPVSFEGGNDPVYIKFPKFGTDVKIHMPDEESLKDLKMSQRYVSGIYVGAHKKDRRVSLVWVNYHRPGERAQIVLADEIKASGEKKYMEIVQMNLRKAEKALRLAFYNGFKCYDREYNNLEMLEFSGGGYSMVDMDLNDNTPRFVQVVVSDEIRKTFMKHVKIETEDDWEKKLISVTAALELL